MIPPNTTGLLYLPGDVTSKIMESGKDIRQNSGVSFVLRDDHHAVYEAGAGTYSFTVQR